RMTSSTSPLTSSPPSGAARIDKRSATIPLIGLEVQWRSNTSSSQNLLSGVGVVEPRDCPVRSLVVVVPRCPCAVLPFFRLRQLHGSRTPRPPHGARPLPRSCRPPLDPSRRAGHVDVGSKSCAIFLNFAGVTSSPGRSSQEQIAKPANRMPRRVLCLLGPLLH